MKVLTDVTVSGYTGYVVCNNEQEVEELQANPRNRVKVLGEILLFKNCNSCNTLLAVIGAVDNDQKSAEISTELNGESTCGLIGKSSAKCVCGKVYRTPNRSEWFTSKLHPNL